MIGRRNQDALAGEDIQRRLIEWGVLCGDREIELDVSEASRTGSSTRFSETHRKVFLGANVMPGLGTSANARMSPLACLAHELAHYDRFIAGYDRPHQLPDVLLDEAETSIRASFESVLSARDRDDLVEDARDRLNQWLQRDSDLENR
jgi:hypothetical protein